MYFATCARSGKYLIPVDNAYPFLMMMGKVVMGWLLRWEAGVAQKNLTELSATMEANSTDSAFYTGKIFAARFFIKHVLPEVEGVVKAIKSEDLSIIEIPEESFAS